MVTGKRREGDGLPPPDDLGRVTSTPLVEVRTVLSRAQTALLDLDMPMTLTADGWRREQRAEPLPWTVTHGEPVWVADEMGFKSFDGWTDPVTAPHPQGEDMVEALRRVVELLEPWARTGR